MLLKVLKKLKIRKLKLNFKQSESKTIKLKHLHSLLLCGRHDIQTVSFLN